MAFIDQGQITNVNYHGGKPEAVRKHGRRGPCCGHQCVWLEGGLIRKKSDPSVFPGVSSISLPARSLLCPDSSGRRRAAHCTELFVEADICLFGCDALSRPIPSSRLCGHLCPHRSLATTWLVPGRLETRWRRTRTRHFLAAGSLTVYSCQGILPLLGGRVLRGTYRVGL